MTFSRTTRIIYSALAAAGLVVVSMVISECTPERPLTIYTFISDSSKHSFNGTLAVTSGPVARLKLIDIRNGLCHETKKIEASTNQMVSSLAGPHRDIVALTTTNGELLIAHLLKGSRTLTVSTVRSKVGSSVALSPNGQLVAYFQLTRILDTPLQLISVGQLIVINWAENKVVLQIDNVIDSGFSWSPVNPSLILYSSYTKGSSIMCLNLVSKKSTAITSGEGPIFSSRGDMIIFEAQDELDGILYGIYQIGDGTVTRMRLPGHPIALLSDKAVLYQDFDEHRLKSQIEFDAPGVWLSGKPHPDAYVKVAKLGFDSVEALVHLDSPQFGTLCSFSPDVVPRNGD